ncbi:MAG: M16 family metallopeptidase [Phycisphaerales bacterium]
MRLFRIAAVGAAVLASAQANAQQVEPIQFTLDNGMEFMLYPRSEEPNIIAAGWLAKVGSVNERPGITGISHYLEHMLFKGTGTIGTNDLEADRASHDEQRELQERLLSQVIDVQYDRWRRGEISDPWDATYDTDEMREIRSELREVVDAHKTHVVTNEFDRVYTTKGASGMNAFTSHDLTMYFINVPSNKFELWAWMESDRLSTPSFREFVSENGVVIEERKQVLESTPTGRIDEQIDSVFWSSTPYSWPIVGWPTDISGYAYDNLTDYFDTYYDPSNLVGIVVGDFNPSEVKSVIEEYFGRLETTNPVIQPVVTIPIHPAIEKRIDAECDCQTRVRVMYPAPPFRHADGYVLEVLTGILNGRTGRLYKSMVEGDEIADRASASYQPRKYGGALEFTGFPKNEATTADLEAAWEREVELLKTEPVTERELQKIKNQTIADSFRRLQSNFFILVQLGYYEGLGGWEYMNESPEQIQAVTPSDIMRVANQYFDHSIRTVATYTRQEVDLSTMDPELAAMTPEQREQVQMMLAQMAQASIDQLKQVLPMIEQQASSVPAEDKAAFDYMLKKLRERVEAEGN